MLTRTPTAITVLIGCLRNELGFRNSRLNIHVSELGMVSEVKQKNKMKKYLAAKKLWRRVHIMNKTEKMNDLVLHIKLTRVDST